MNTPSRTRPLVGPRLVVPTHCCDIYSHSGGIYRISGKLGITCRDSLVLTVAVLTYASASFGRAAILAASARLTRDRSPLTRQTQRAHDHTRVSGNTTRAQPCSGIGASLGARALCALLGRAPLLTSLRASLGRFKRSRASSGSVRQEASGAQTQPGPASRREEGPTSLRAPRVARTPSPRSALRASLGRFKRSRASSGSVRQEASGAQTQPGPALRREEGPTSLRAPRVARTPPPLITSLRAPRVARNARPHERSALVAPCVGRWRAALAR